ncbi:MAG: response regulator transcription factor [Ignavibacteriaceae bacterium]|jgi:DNA-binding NarL/FixJ family response regulator|nr:response regulator transcription factor [Ignavibacteriaceae bacterium]
MEKIKVLFADDHNLVRQGIIGLLKESEKIIVVGEGECGRDIIEKYPLVNPDIVLSDITMPNLSGFDAAIEILKNYPDAKFLFLSMFHSEEYIYKIHSIGGKGLISKDTNVEDLDLAITRVCDGGRFYNNLSEDEINDIIRRFEALSNKNRPYNLELSPRERVIMRHLAKGKSSEEIALEIGIGKRSIDAARSAIMNKLRLNTSAKLLAHAVENYND